MNESALPGNEIRSVDIDRQTAATKARYNRIAPVYDLMEAFSERSAFQEWRRDLWARLPSGRILEVGVGTLMDLANPLVVRMMGANINRQTVENVRLAGLQILGVEDLKGDLVKLIHARA